MIKFKEKLWKYQAGKAAWHFVTLPKEQSLEIKYQNLLKINGWGSIRIEARIGKTTWQTSIFPDAKSGCYFLPIKAEVRKKEGLNEDDLVEVILKAV